MEAKSGYKSTEFWLSVAAVLIGALLASGVLPADSFWLKAAGLAAGALASLGYTVSRGFVKAGVSNALAAKAFAEKKP